MPKIQKTVFISYRRTNIYTARAVYEHLKANGYDVFLDYESIDSGAFGEVILRQIEARAHFIIVLTPSALERCAEPGDWLRREIEHAIDHKRNIVPLMFDNFDFRAVSPYLAGKLSVLSTYNGVKIPEDYFNEAMERLRTRFLNIPLEMVLHPTPTADKPIIDRKVAQVDAAPTPTDGQLKAEDYYERGKKADEAKDYTLAIAYLTEALHLNPRYVHAYVERSHVRYQMGDMDGTMADADAAIRLDPKSVTAYINRGSGRGNKGDYDGAMADYNEAIRLDPKSALAYTNRGDTYRLKGNYDAAILDVSRAIELDPQLKFAYGTRAAAREKKGDLEGAIRDYEAALHLDPNYQFAKDGLESIRKKKQGR